jgi:hypothetical protein
VMVGVRAALVAVRGANASTEGKGVPALVTGPRGAAFLRSSRASPNTFRRHRQGWARSTSIVAVDLVHPLSAP